MCSYRIKEVSEDCVSHLHSPVDYINLYFSTYRNKIYSHSHQGEYAKNRKVSE